MRRHKLGKSFSKRLFTSKAVRKPRVNFVTRNPMRGGIRL